MFCGSGCGGGGGGAGPVRWVADNDVATCSTCLVDFSFLLRRHHCRRCGDIYCGACSLDRERVLRCDELDPVRVCHECSLTAQVENAFEEHHCPALMAGGLFLKHGLVRMRRVFVSLTPDHRHILYQSANPDDRSDAKRILVGSITEVELISSHSLRLVAGDRDHIFDADSELMASQWLRSLECMLQLVSIPEPWNARASSAGKTTESGLYGSGGLGRMTEYEGPSQNQQPSSANTSSRKWSKHADKMRAKYSVPRSSDAGLSTRDLNGMR